MSGGLSPFNLQINIGEQIDNSPEELRAAAVTVAGRVPADELEGILTMLGYEVANG